MFVLRSTHKRELSEANMRLARFMTETAKQRANLEYREMMAKIERDAFEEAFKKVSERLEVMVAAMDEAVEHSYMKPIVDALAEYRKPVNITWFNHGGGAA